MFKIYTTLAMSKDQGIQTCAHYLPTFIPFKKAKNFIPSTRVTPFQNSLGCQTLSKWNPEDSPYAHLSRVPKEIHFQKGFVPTSLTHLSSVLIPSRSAPSKKTLKQRRRRCRQKLIKTSLAVEKLKEDVRIMLLSQRPPTPGSEWLDKVSYEPTSTLTISNAPWYEEQDDSANLSTRPSTPGAGWMDL